ncbi:MAG TPA: DUF3300 domain-containing protein [Bryobacteraceae bacterium]|nr:DUF3300 domain-containing protein [Bryobacteraceae bacterium]
MNSKSRCTPFSIWRQLTAVLLSVALIPTAQIKLSAQPPSAYVGLNADQLDQLVAPIALYPDSLVASVLTASTYPDQIGEANAWLVQNMNLAPDQRAAAADAQPWDPSVKALIPFPQVLDTLARNSAWTSQLGNAYFNQPGDVENAVQAMRLQAQQSGRLVTTPQERVIENDGIIEIAPVNPAVVYVPYYNPWAVWGGFVTPWPGWYAVAPPPGIVIGVGVAFGVGIGIGLYAHYGWGFHAWRPAWGGGGVVYGGRPYVSRSVTVINHGDFGGHDRGVFERGGRGVPAGYHAVAHVGAARAAAERAGVRAGSPRVAPGFAGRGAPAGRPGFNGGARPNAAAGRVAPAGRPAPGARPAERPGFSGARPNAEAGRRAPAVRPEPAARPNFAPNRSAAPRPNAGFNRPNATAPRPNAAPSRPAAPAVHPGGGGGGRPAGGGGHAEPGGHHK